MPVLRLLPLSVLLGGRASATPPDPLVTLVWTAEGDEVESFFGFSVAGAGDVNDDGFDDIVVGAPQFDLLYDYMEDPYGEARVYLGSAAGPEGTAAWTVEGGSRALFGHDVASAGDMNGDGFADVLVGEPLGAGAGSAALFTGSITGLPLEPDGEVTIPEPPADAPRFGFSVSSAGDVNADGYADAIAGAPTENVAVSDEGRAYVFMGTALGLGDTPAWSSESPEEGGQFGFSVSAAGDVNSDGFDDVLVGAPFEDVVFQDEGRAYLFFGSADGLDSEPAWTAESIDLAGNFGYAVAAAGDVDGDGFGDVIVGVPGFGGTAKGAAYVYTGSATGPPATAAWAVESDQKFAEYGRAVASAGDLDADGFDEVVVGTGMFEDGLTEEGRADVYRGSAAGPEVLAAWSEQSNVISANFGDAVASAGDTNGDGLSDVIVGSPGWGSHYGRAEVYLGQGEVDLDGDGVPEGEDCDDANATVFPGAEEVCDGLDTACAGVVPSDELDVDLDTVRPCDGDCDDANPAAYPGAPQQCDGIDNPCLGSVPVDELDADADTVRPCGGDCDDADPTASAALDEVCDDDADNNCNGEVDEDCVTPPPTEEESVPRATGCGCVSPGVPPVSSFVLGLALFATFRRRGRGR